MLLFLCVRRKGKRESERERERKAQKQKAAKKQQTKKKKKERTRVIFDVKAFFSILISREESQLQSSQKHHKTRTNHHQISRINNVCGWD